jgi:hypothetical protein
VVRVFLGLDRLLHCVFDAQVIVEHTMEKSIKAEEYPDHTVAREFSEDGKIEQGQSKSPGK